MATDLLWQRTQLEVPRLPNVAGYPDEYHVPQGHTGQATAAYHNNQLQFNLGIPPSSGNLNTKFRKPRPIIIEKLTAPSDGVVTSDRGNLSVSSSVSSDRLALAVRLARRDVRKSKEAPTTGAEVSGDREARERHREVGRKERTKETKKDRVRKRKERTQNEEATSLRERVQKAVKRQEITHKPVRVAGIQEPESTKRGKQYFFYPATDDDNIEFESEGELKQAREIRRLRGELRHYMKKVEELQCEQPSVVKNSDKRLKKRKQEDRRLSDDEEDRRQAARQEEQAARSARMLYTLQTQVQEIENELNKRRRGIKHTKKSQTLSRLAAAHRGAVRALQTFISHVPLQAKISHGLPPPYQELSLLIRQLSALSAQLQIGGDDGGVDQKLLEERGVDAPQGKLSGAPKPKSSGQAAKQSPEKRQRSASSTPHNRRDAPRPDTDSPDPTPERDAVLRAGLAALLRAKQTPITPGVPVKTKVQHRHPPVPVKKSVLLPAKLKIGRQKSHQVAQAPRAVNLQQAHFAQETVSSKLKKAPPGPPPVRPQITVPPRSPLTTPTKHGPYERHCLAEVEERAPRTPRRKLDEQMKSPRSPKFRKLLPTDEEMMERELDRQLYLDREADRQLREMEELRMRNYVRRHRESESNALSRRLIRETEEAIESKLKPLLDRAEAIAREQDKTGAKAESLQRRLAQVSTQTTVDQAGVISDKILDELIEETAVEMQRLELEEEAEGASGRLLTSSTLENMLERLQTFEKVEDDIRRHWVHVQYADAERPRVTNGSPDSRIEKPSLRNEAKKPRAIVFTMPQAEPSEARFLSDRIRKLRDHEEEEPLTEELLTEGDTPESSQDSYTLSSDGPVVRPQAQPASGTFLHRVNPPLRTFVPSSLRASIAAYRARYERYLRHTATHAHGSFDPWGLVETISEDLLEDILQDVGAELQGVSDDYTEQAYSHEFAAYTGDDSRREANAQTKDGKA